MARVLVCVDRARSDEFARAFAGQPFDVRLAVDGGTPGVGETVAFDALRLGTLLPLLAETSCLCWCFGMPARPAAEQRELHTTRLQSVLERIVDSPVRAFVYEVPAVAPAAEGAVDLPPSGELVRSWCERLRIRHAVVGTDSAAQVAARQVAAAALALLGVGDSAA